MITIITPEQEIHQLFFGDNSQSSPRIREHIRFYDLNTNQYFYMNMDNKICTKTSGIEHHFVRNFVKDEKIVTFEDHSNLTIKLNYAKIIWNCHPFDRLILDPSKTSINHPCVFRAVIPVLKDRKYSYLDPEYRKCHGFVFKIFEVESDEYIHADLGKNLLIIEALQLNYEKTYIYNRIKEQIEISYDQEIFDKYVHNFIVQVERLCTGATFGIPTIDLCDQGACISMYNIDLNFPHITSLEQDLMENKVF